MSNVLRGMLGKESACLKRKKVKLSTAEICGSSRGKDLTATLGAQWGCLGATQGTGDECGNWMYTRDEYTYHIIYIYI